MEFRQLKYAVRVSETLRFGKAAELEHIAPSVLSTQIRRLENELGVALFDRASGRVSLTAAGEHFIEDACDILDCLAELKADTQAIARTRAPASPSGSSARRSASSPTCSSTRSPRPAPMRGSRSPSSP